jgi:hypothetical protein
VSLLSQEEHALRSIAWARTPDWPLRVDGQTVDMLVLCTVRSSDGETLRHLGDARSLPSFLELS